MPFLWSFAEPPPVPVEVARWAWPITVRPERVFELRVRLPRVESGHRETGVPYEED